jgi:hypothetical protein
LTVSAKAGATSNTKAAQIEIARRPISVTLFCRGIDLSTPRQSCLLRPAASIAAQHERTKE